MGCHTTIIRQIVTWLLIYNGNSRYHRIWIVVYWPLGPYWISLRTQLYSPILLLCMSIYFDRIILYSRHRTIIFLFMKYRLETNHRIMEKVDIGKLVGCQSINYQTGIHWNVNMEGDIELWYTCLLGLQLTNLRTYVFILRYPKLTTIRTFCDLPVLFTAPQLCWCTIGWNACERWNSSFEVLAVFACLSSWIEV